MQSAPLARTIMKQLAWLFAPALMFAPQLAHADPPEVAVKAKAILQAHCADCHGGGKANKGGFGFVLDRDLLVNRLLVAPGKVKGSELFQRIEEGEMPPPSKKNRPSAAERAVLQR